MVFLSNKDVFPQMKLFFIHPNERKMLSPAFQNLTLPVSKLKWEGDLLLILGVINLMLLVTMIS